MIFYTFFPEKLFRNLLTKPIIDYNMTYYGSMNMDNKEKPKGNLDKLQIVYDNLNDTEKGKVVRLGEGLLKSQNIIDEKVKPAENNKEKS